MPSSRAAWLVAALLVTACQARETAPTAGNALPDPAAAAPLAKADVQHLGAPMGEAPSVSLVDLAKGDGRYDGKTVKTGGTVTAVCQQAGCWMEIRDDENAEAHVKLAGHSFFVPRMSAGKHATVQARVVRTAPLAKPADDCDEEAAKQTGKRVPKVELEAVAVDLS